ncbi:unnamed protein product [Withania somnifera]
MYGVICRLGSDIQKDPDIDGSTLSRKSIEVLKFSSSPTVVYISSFKSQSSTDVTFFALEPNGRWRVLVLPYQYLYRETCWKSPQSNINSLQVGSLLPLTSLLFGRQKIQRVRYIDSTLGSILPSSSLHHKGALTNLDERNMLSITSSGQNPMTKCEFLGTISHESDAISVEDVYTYDSKKKDPMTNTQGRNLETRGSGTEISSAVQNNHARKESYPCIWKKVQKRDADVRNCDSEKLNLVFSQFDDRSKKNTLKKKFANHVDSIILSQPDHENQEKLKVPKKPKRHKYASSLQENESQCGKGSPVNGACSNACLKTNMQSDDVFGSPTADSQTRTSSFRARYKKRNVQYVPLKSTPNLKACSHDLDAKETVPIVVSSVDDQTVEHQFLLPRSGKFNGLIEQQRKLLVDGEGDKMEKEVSPSDQIKHEHDAVPQAISESWMHQELKDSELPNCFSVVTLIEPEKWTSKISTRELLASKFLAPLFSSVSVRLKNAGQNVENIKASPGMCTLEQGCNNAAMAKFFHPEAKSKTFHSVENDWRNIAQAVNDAHRAQLASKAIEIGKGYPAAEFEKLLHSASPIICPSASIQTCLACFGSRATNAPLCRHEIPNVVLRNLWQWYEKHGSYGLEVKAEDRGNARQCGMDGFEFRAYFVPYFSAIQLFKNHRTHPIHNDNWTLGSMEVDCKMNRISESSRNVELRSIFSVLVPQPRVEDSSSLLQKGVMVMSDDMELLFEYFESEQPQRQRPLFETVQELVSGDGPSSNCRSYGDPSILHTVSLHDLHPHSWFSVAWYPIYRIPDGNLRAAFLTYHSLGHFIHREQSLKDASMDASMVSPILGLLSYNAQGECWFQPRHSADHLTDEFLDTDLHTVLRERLRALEQTTSIMSRAVRKIGSDTVVNIHPDYEFFLSRWR